MLFFNLSVSVMAIGGNKSLMSGLILYNTRNGLAIAIYRADTIQTKQTAGGEVLKRLQQWASLLAI
jgi:hypothetical protein